MPSIFVRRYCDQSCLLVSSFARSLTRSGRGWDFWAHSTLFLLSKIMFVRTRSIQCHHLFEMAYLASYRGHDLQCTRSRDVIGHVSIWCPIRHFLQVLYCNKVCISSCFRDNWPQTFWVHDLEFSKSCDVIIDHMTNRFPIFHFLLVGHWYWGSISKRFLDICI